MADLVRLGPGWRTIIGTKSGSGRLYKDGSLLITPNPPTVTARRRLKFAGIVSVALALSENGALVADPEIELVGFPENDAGGASMADIVRDAVEEACKSLRSRDGATPIVSPRRCGGRSAGRLPSAGGRSRSVSSTF